MSGTSTKKQTSLMRSFLILSLRHHVNGSLDTVNLFGIEFVALHRKSGMFR